MTFKFDFIHEPYLRAVLRVAYLAAFKQFGYNYLLSEGATQVRRVLNDGELPGAFVMQAFPSSDPLQPVLIHAIDSSAMLVLFRLRI